MEKTTRICAHCGAYFESDHPRAIHCSRACSVKRTNARHNALRYVVHEPTPCPGCGTIFTPKRSDSKFCSNRCKQRSQYVPKVSPDRLKVCEYCQGSFSPLRSDARFCSDTCWTRHRKAVPRVRLCARCGEDITSSRPRVRYCTGCKAIRVREHYDRNNERARQRTKGPRTVRCVACDVEFRTSHSHQKACSNTCGEWARRHPGIRRNPSGQCLTCGAEFVANKAGRQRYCSLRCTSAASKRRTRDIKAAYAPARHCHECGDPMPPGKRAGSKYCSRPCAMHASNAPGRFAERFGRTCERCGIAIPDSARLNKRFCTTSCQVMFNQDIRRARKRGLPVERISRAAIYERDGMICHLCQTEITEKPTLDHIIPIAHPDCPGHVWENVAAAHRFCNNSKRDRVKQTDFDLYERLRRERQLRG